MLLILPWSPDLPAGVSVVVRNLTRTWQSEGRTVKILVSDWETPTLEANERGIFSLRLAFANPTSLRRFLRSCLAAPGVLLKTWRFLRAEKISSVNFHYASLDALGIAILKRLGLYHGELVLCFHGTDVSMSSNPIQHLMWRFVFDSSDGVTACSHSLARQVEATFRLASGRVNTVYNGVDTLTFMPGAAVPSTPDDRPYIVTVGSFIDRKGHRFLLDAFASIAGKYPETDLVLVGADGPARIPLAAQSEHLGLSKRIRFMIDLSPQQVATTVAGAILSVQPSLAEPFGMAVIEAGACGVCVAASRVGGHAELIVDNESGRLFLPGDMQSLAEVLEALLGDPQTRTRMASRFRSEILNQFTWQSCANAYRTAGATRNSPQRSSRAVD